MTMLTKAKNIILRYIVPYLLLPVAISPYFLSLALAMSICQRCRWLYAGGGDQSIGVVFGVALLGLASILIVFLYYIFLMIIWQFRKNIIKWIYRLILYCLFTICLSLTICTSYSSFKIWATLVLAIFPLIGLIVADLSAVTYFKIVDANGNRVCGDQKD